ncbi:hypothetical protein [Nannocystis pusilla]|uniref:Uncharacterized protein n=1 Tax=Nannocystis pusilla TaxID=889268 RepID=A0ABS7TK67_9BACT|nr:hypothetical protein [Nannocystis pusilla]MBZ5708623.1 hypothetical protein [Nannocystis pusilla]
MGPRERDVVERPRIEHVQWLHVEGRLLEELTLDLAARAASGAVAVNSS